MANTDAPFGFRPSGKVGGNPDNGALTEQKIKSDYATAMFQGDLVKFNAGYINISAAGNTGLMVFNGLKYDDSSTNKPTFKNFFDGTALGVEGEVFVYDDPYQVYEAQTDSDEASTQAHVGTFADHIKTHSGNTTTGISGDEIDLPSSPSATLTGVKVLGLAQTPDNALGTNSVVRCYIADAVHIN
jgi:hypothetical protein|tara:strand:- start:42 stop:599 length:558 start_codon:yes stop_codon:yes gene_type:complete